MALKRILHSWWEPVCCFTPCRTAAKWRSCTSVFARRQGHFLLEIKADLGKWEGGDSGKTSFFARTVYYSISVDTKMDTTRLDTAFTMGN
jgi:hypothetical protein